MGVERLRRGTIGEVGKKRTSKPTRFRAPISLSRVAGGPSSGAIPAAARRAWADEDDVERNRDKVPSSRPVTPANDIQIPLGQRDVRLTTFGLQIGWLLSPRRDRTRALVGIMARREREKDERRGHGKGPKKRGRLNRERLEVFK